MAGGLGTRLRGVVDELPKALAPVAGRPFIAYLLDALDRAGVEHAVLATGYRGDQIEAAIGCRWAGMQISYSREERPLGTGGAARKALAKITGDSVLVLNADTYLRFDPRSFANEMHDAGAVVGMALARVEDIGRYGQVEMQGSRVIAFHEKGGQGSGWINAGVYYFSRGILERYPASDTFSLEQVVLPEAAHAGELHAYTDTSEFIDIGIPADYERAQRLAPAWTPA